MRAKQTSPPAAVQRFKGGKYNVDGDEGLIKNLFERRKVEDTDYSEGVKPTAPVARGFFLGDYEGLQSMGSGFLALFAKTNCNLSPSDPNAPPTGNPLCGPASSNVTPTPNTNPNDVFSAINEAGKI